MEPKTRVLIADSGEDFRLLLTDIIEAEGDMEVVGTANDGIEALVRLAETHPDVLLLDLVLTKLDGLGVLQKIPETGEKPAAIVISGFFNEHVLTEAAELGAYYFMPKPCDIPHFSAGSARYLQLARTKRRRLKNRAYQYNARNKVWRRLLQTLFTKSAYPRILRVINIFEKQSSLPSTIWI